MVRNRTGGEKRNTGRRDGGMKRGRRKGPGERRKKRKEQKGKNGGNGEGKEAAEVGVSGGGARTEASIIRKSEEREMERKEGCTGNRRRKGWSWGKWRFVFSDPFGNAELWGGKCGAGRHPQKRGDYGG